MKDCINFSSEKKVSLTSCLWSCSSSVIFCILSLGNRDICLLLQYSTSSVYLCISYESHNIQGLFLNRIIQFASAREMYFLSRSSTCFEARLQIFLATINFALHVRLSVIESEIFGRTNSLFSSDAKRIRICNINVILYSRTTERVWCP